MEISVKDWWESEQKGLKHRNHPAMGPKGDGGSGSGGSFGQGVLNLTPQQLADSKATNKKMENTIFTTYGVSGAFNTGDLAKNNKQFVQQEITDKLFDHPAFTENTAMRMTKGEVIASFTRENIAQWASSSGDTSAASIALQLTAKEHFKLEDTNVEHLGKENKEQVKVANYNRDSNYPVSGDGAYKLKDVQSAFLQAQYDATQKYFKDAGIKEVILYRGVEHFDGGKLRTEEVSLQPMSSFSTDAKQALLFSKIHEGSFDPPEGREDSRGTLYASVVPVEKILSHPRTGFGCTKEKEVVVLGGRIKATVVPTKIAVEVKFTADNMELRDMKNSDFNANFLTSLNKVVPEFREKGLGLSSFKHLQGQHDQMSHGGGGHKDLSSWDDNQIKNIFNVMKREETIPEETFLAGVQSRVYRSLSQLWYSNKLEKQIGISRSTINQAILPAIFQPCNSTYAGTHVVESVSRTLGIERSPYDIQSVQDTQKRSSWASKRDINLDIKANGFSFDGRTVSDENMDKIVKATYDNTQKLLKDNSIEEIVVYRGVTTKRSTEKGNALESWTAEKSIADGFAITHGAGGIVADKGYVETKIIPAKNIFAVPGSGWGVSSQLEVIVLNDTPHIKGLDNKYYEEVMSWERWLKEGVNKEDYIQPKKSLGLSAIFKGGVGSGILGHRTIRQATSKLTPEQQATALAKLKEQQLGLTKTNNEKWNDVSTQMDKNLKTIADGTATHKSVEGIADTKHIKTIVSNIKSEADLYTKYLASDTAVKLRDFTSTYENILHEGIRNGEFKNLNAKDLDAFGIDSVKKMVHQEVESNRQQFTDHGIRHVYGNIERQLEIMDSISDKVLAKDKLAALAIMVNHDMGYTTKDVRVGGLEGVAASRGHKDNSFEMYNSQKATWNENKLFTPKEFDRVVNAIKTHDSTEMDKDPLLTSTRISDNLALFAKEKLPSMFKYVEGGKDYLVKMGAAAKKGDNKTFESLRNGLYRTIDNSALNVNLKRDLKAGTREINLMTPKFSMGVLAGEISNISGNKKGKVDVTVKYSAYDAFLQNHFDMGQKQTKKLLGDYGITDFSKTSYDIGDKLNVKIEGYKPIATPSPGKLPKSIGLGTIFKHLPGKHDQMSHGRGGGERLAGGLGGLSNPTPTDLKRSKMPLPQSIKDRSQRDYDEDGIMWRILLNKMEIVDTPEDLYIESDKNRQGRCYEFAARLVMNNQEKDWTLVHGNLFPLLGPFQDMPYNHGWAEKGNLVYDGVVNKFFTKESYYKAMEPVDLRKYDYKEMYKFMLKKKTYGDWE